jgi:hypothetical protein
MPRQERPVSPEPEADLEIRGVAQRHPMSCGLACVSFITGESYDTIVDGEPQVKLEEAGFLCPELVDKLEEHGQHYSWKKLEEDERDGDFKVGDIVFIEPSNAIPGGHFLAKSTAGWMDPWINLDLARPFAAEAEAGFRDALPGRAEYLVYKLPTVEDSQQV